MKHLRTTLPRNLKMDLYLKPAKAKQYSDFQKGQPLPITVNKSGETIKFLGIFNGFAVTIHDRESMEILQKNGAFGKANLSRNWPNFKHFDAEIIRERQFINRKRFPKTDVKNKVIVVPDSDSGEEYLKQLTPRYEMDYTNFKEILQLSLVEALFLHHDLQCLNIDMKGQVKSEDHIAMWDTFSNSNKYFIQDYTIYYHFRVKNWVVKPGIKFGGDFILYKDGPAFTHASYVVLIEVLNEDLHREISETRRTMDFTYIVGLNRLCETAGKELLICQIIWPRSVSVSRPSDIKHLSVNEVLLRRWLPNTEKQLKTV